MCLLITLNVPIADFNRADYPASAATFPLNAKTLEVTFKGSLFADFLNCDGGDDAELLDLIASPEFVKLEKVK